jgi:hypothetical protein
MCQEPILTHFRMHEDIERNSNYFSHQAYISRSVQESELGLADYERGLLITQPWPSVTKIKKRRIGLFISSFVYLLC